MKKFLSRELLLEHRKVIVKAAVGLMVLIAAFVLYGNENDNNIVTDGTTGGVSAESEVSTSTVVVDICGEVRHPTVATLAAGSRVEDAINEAGGLTEDADITDINRAKLLEDGEKIYIPSEDETAASAAGGSDGSSGGGSSDSSGSSGSSSGISSSGKVNINTASSEELQTLNGVGPATAEKIIDYRETYGSFKTTSDIQNVNGIGEKTYEKLRDYITT